VTHEEAARFLEPEYDEGITLAQEALADVRAVLGDRWWPAHETLEGAVRNLVNVAVLDEEVRRVQKARIEELERSAAWRITGKVGAMAVVGEIRKMEYRQETDLERDIF